MSGVERQTRPHFEFVSNHNKRKDNCGGKAENDMWPVRVDVYISSVRRRVLTTHAGPSLYGCRRVGFRLLWTKCSRHTFLPGGSVCHLVWPPFMRPLPLPHIHIYIDFVWAAKKLSTGRGLSPLCGVLRPQDVSWQKASGFCLRCKKEHTSFPLLNIHTTAMMNRTSSNLCRSDEMSPTKKEEHTPRAINKCVEGGGEEEELS